MRLRKAGALTMAESPWRDWMPIAVRLRQAGCVVDWCYFAGIRPTDPFFQQTVNHALSDPARMLFRRETPVGHLGDLAWNFPGIAPAGFIFHLSRCGSTLVSRLLATLPRTLVISEPPALDQLLHLSGTGAPGSSESARRALRGLVSAIAQPRNGEDRLFIKFDSWHVCELPAILEAFPGVPWIFLYRDPVEILVSQDRMPGIQMVPGIIDPRRLGLDPATVNPAALDGYSARVLAQFCGAAIENRGNGRGLFVNYRELPGAIFGAISRHFGLEMTHEEQATMEEAAKFDAKSPGFVFEDDSAGKQREASDRIRELAKVWLAEPYEKLESIRRAQA
jgi:hypothetical protein